MACNSGRAEFLALDKGLILARDLKIGQLIVQMDNLAYIQVLQQQNACRGENTHFIKQYIELHNKPDWKVRLIHVYREGNRAANWLANHGIT